MRVIRTPNFDRLARRAGLDEAALADLVKALVERPTLGPVMPGTGGARKVRVRLRGRGKSGGARLIYAVVLRSSAIALLDCYAKSEREDLTADDRKRIAMLLREIEQGFSR